MNAPTPSLLELAQMCSDAATEVVEVYLSKDDHRGADEYLARFKEIAGPRAHDAVMKVLEEIYGSPDWRTF